jgi:hypothetical protein
MEEPRSPRRPLTSYVLPTAFSAGLHLSIKEPRSRTSFHEVLKRDTYPSNTLHTTPATEAIRENRLKRTFEGLATNMTKLSQKMGLSRPLRSDTVQPKAGEAERSSSAVSKMPSKSGLGRSGTKRSHKRSKRSNSSTKSFEKMSRPCSAVVDLDSAVDVNQHGMFGLTQRPTRLQIGRWSQPPARSTSIDALRTYFSRDYNPQSNAESSSSQENQSLQREAVLEEEGTAVMPLAEIIMTATPGGEGPEDQTDVEQSLLHQMDVPHDNTYTQREWPLAASPSPTLSTSTTPIPCSPQSSEGTLTNDSSMEMSLSPDQHSPVEGPDPDIMDISAPTSPSPMSQTFQIGGFTIQQPPQTMTLAYPYPPYPSSYFFSPMAGAGARAAVQSHNSTIMSSRSIPVYPPAPMKSIVVCGTCSNRACTAIDCKVEKEWDLKRCDPAKELPMEMMLMVFGNLDHKSLAKAALVSPTWHEIATANTVWRDAFRSRYLPANYRKARSYMQVGGLGMGPDGRTPRDWQAMMQARLSLEKKWKEASPAAIYFNGHTDSVYCCQFDEHKIITGSRDRTIRVWDLVDYRCLKVIGGPEHRPVKPNPSATPLEKHPNWQVNVNSLNGTPAGNKLFHIPAFYHDASILCLQFDDKILVTGSSDHTVIVWDISTYEPVTRLRYHGGGVLDICFDERFIVSCSKDQKIAIWSRETYELLQVLDEHAGPVNAIQLRGDTLLSGAGDGKAMLWCLKTFKLLNTFDTGDRGLAAVELTEDGKHALVGGNEFVIRRYDTANAEPQHTYSGHLGLVRTLHADCTNKRIVTGSYDQSVRVWDFETGKPMGDYRNWTTSWILSIKSDYRRIVCTSQDGRVLMMDFGWKLPGMELLKNPNSSHGHWDVNGRSKDNIKYEPLALPVVKTMSHLIDPELN